MFIHNINPVMFTMGTLEIRYYGLVYVLGFLLVYWILRKRSKTLSHDQIDSLMIYLFVGLLAGARLFEAIFWQSSYYFSNPLKIFYIWEGGMSFHGGFVGIVVAGYLFSKKYKINFFELADMLSIPAVLGLAVGRIANFINGELPGKIADVNWCVKFPNFEGCRHPYTLYLALKRFAVFGLLIFLDKKEYKPGFIFWNFVLWDGAGRLIFDFYKDEILYFGLAPGQWLSIVMIIVAGFFLWYNYKEDVKKLF